MKKRFHQLWHSKVFPHVKKKGEGGLRGTLQKEKREGRGGEGFLLREGEKAYLSKGA